MGILQHFFAIVNKVNLEDDGTIIRHKSPNPHHHAEIITASIDLRVPIIK